MASAGARAYNGVWGQSPPRGVQGADGILVLEHTVLIKPWIIQRPVFGVGLYSTNYCKRMKLLFTACRPIAVN